MQVRRVDVRVASDQIPNILRLNVEINNKKCWQYYSDRFQHSHGRLPFSLPSGLSGPRGCVKAKSMPQSSPACMYFCFLFHHDDKKVQKPHFEAVSLPILFSGFLIFSTESEFHLTTTSWYESV
jgi:hypothetical protein